MSFSEQTQCAPCLHGKYNAAKASYTAHDGWLAQSKEAENYCPGRRNRKETKHTHKKSHMCPLELLLFFCQGVAAAATYVLLLYITALGLINNTP